MPNLFQKATGFMASMGGFWTRTGGQGYGRTRVYLPSSKFDFEAEAGDLWSNPVIALGLDWLGNRFPRPVMQVCRIGRDGQHNALGRHPLIDLWNRPNTFYSRRTLEKAVGLSLRCDGNAYVYKLRDRLGKVVQLWWVPHYRIMPMWPADGTAFINGYRIWSDAQQTIVPVEDVIHIRDGIDPRNERFGLSATKGCIREVCTVNLESGYTSSLLRNSAVPGLLVVPDDPSGNLRPSKEDSDRIKGRIADAFSREGVGSTVVLAGRYKVQPVGFSPEQLMLDRLPQSAQARVAASIGVAAMSIGLPDPNKTYANLAEANRSSWGTVVSIQEIVDEALRWELLPEFGDDPYKMVVARDYSHIQELQESLDAIHLRTREDWKAGIITRGEARDQLGYKIEGEEGEYDENYFPGTGADDPVLPEIHEDDLTAAAQVEPVKPDDAEPPKPEPDAEEKPADDAEKAVIVIIEDGIELAAKTEANQVTTPA